MHTGRPKVNRQTGQQAAIRMQQAGTEAGIFPGDRFENVADRFATGGDFVMAAGERSQGRGNVNRDNRSFAEHGTPPFGWYR